ncbi:MAG TPA: ACS family MFS transporter [Steroidobacteraceae bacterium]|nr:ACS family MFS transporter [Steroidobacteraceae bacterium]
MQETTAGMTARSALRPTDYLVLPLLCAAVFVSYIDRTNISVAAIAMQRQFGWNETEKGLVLSAFFMGYILSMVATGALANKYGGKRVLGIAVLWWSLFTILTPPAALKSLPILVMTRIALGLGEAAVFPAAINMIGRWVAPSLRSRAVSLMVSSLYIGTVFALPVTGRLVHSYGWPMPFYLFGAVGLVWTAIWFMAVGDGYRVEPPASLRREPIPWRRLLRLPPLWAIVVAHFSSNWLLYVLLAWLPSYFKHTFGVTLADAGLLSAAPWLTAFVMANLAGHLADLLLRRGRSPGHVRKLMQTIALGGSGISLLLLPGATSLGAGLLLMCCAAGAGAVSLSGFAPNCFDVAPRQADVIWGISNTFATVPGIVGVYATGWLVDRTGSFSAPFLLTAAIALLGALVYLVFASGERLID